MRCRFVAQALLALLSTKALIASPLRVDAKTFESTVKPFLRQNCQACHNAKLSSGGLDATRFLDAKANVALEQRDSLEKIGQRLKAGEMPPPPMRRPTVRK